MANGISNALRCRVCGKEMGESPIRACPMPVEFISHLARHTVHPATLRHFECPDKHGGVVVIPASGASGSEVGKTDELLVN